MRAHAFTFVAGAFALGALATCGTPPKPKDPPRPDPGSGSAIATKPDPGPGSGSAAADPHDPCAEPDTGDGPRPDKWTPTGPDTPYETFAPPFKKVGVGQAVAFSTAIIDQDLDETRVTVTAMPASAKFNAITQTVTWTPTKEDMPVGKFTLEVRQPYRGNKIDKIDWQILVQDSPEPMPVAERLSAVIETLLMIREPKRLEQINRDWPFDKVLLAGAEGFKWQFTPENRAKLSTPLDKRKLFENVLTALAQTHKNARLDPASPKFDKAVFGDPADWKIVAVRPRIDRAWTEMRIVYQAVKAPEPVFAMFRIRPVVEYVPATPRPEPEREANNKIFLGMVAKHLLVNGAPNEKFLKDEVAHGKAVAALFNELMAFEDQKKAEYLKTFVIGIAMEARMGGGSARNPDGQYRSGDGWAWSAMKPFQTSDGKGQAYVNVIIPGFWTETVPAPDGKSWIPRCASKFNPDDPAHEKGWEVLCRKTMGFVDLPDESGDKVKGGRIDANNLYLRHKMKDMVTNEFALDDGRRDVGEENGMTCAQCHIRNFAMHDYGDPANTDPSKGKPTTKNRRIDTLNFQIIPGAKWETFTLEFLKHQECRGKQMFDQYLPGKAKGLGCPLAAKTASTKP